ncbi:MAG TPA: CAP domain-containing protein [Gaiellaceae bacterium]|nr:CAP domain-containing protein [Gaiellaceae bacterium]
MLLRAKLVVAFLAALLLLVAGAAQAASLTRTETRLLALVNGARAHYGVPPLRVDWTLEAAARAHSAEMMRSNSFGHGNFYGRVRSFGVAGGIFGENIAWGSGTDARAAAIVQEWLASPEHRANLLRPEFRRIGIGALGGQFAGLHGVVVVTADFAGK